MRRLVPISEWNEAVKAAGGDDVAEALGYRHSRRLPADNPVFEPLRTLLRERGEWHGTAVELQRELRDDLYRTVFGRLLLQAVPFLAGEFHWEKHTLPRWGVVQFFIHKDRKKCRTRGCWEQELARGRCWTCFSYLHRTIPGWTDDVALDRVRPCCFVGCENALDEAWFEGDFPVCTYHRRCVETTIRIEECGIDVSGFLWDIDWLMAREFHELRRHTASREDKGLYDLIYGNTLLFKLFMQFLDRYQPLLDRIEPM